MNEPFFDAAIIGGGFAGTALALQLRAGLPEGGRILLFEPAPRPGPGLAYSTPDPGHLLNVPAGGMSLFPDRPAHFAEWLGRRPDGPPAPPEGGPVFAPRQLYGAYLQEQLAGTEGIEALPRRVEAVEPLPGGGFRLRGGGESWRAARVVLAIGGFAARAGSPPHLAGDPWDPGTLEGIDPDSPVLLVGMGLTMVDMLLSLRRRGHRRKVTAISRHGWLPLPHVTGPLPSPWPVELPEGAGPVSVSRILRREAARAAEAGQPWQAVADGARPHLQRIWRGWNQAQRASFLRHGRSLWNLHRHRLAPEVARFVAEERASGGLETLAARLGEWQARADGGVDATLRMRGGGERVLPVARVILCVGPDSGSGWREAPPVPALLEQGLARLDPLGLGLEVAGPDGTLLDAQGQPVPGLQVIGALTRGALWEITAVPEIRAQAALIAG
ncbi:FAD/NAD(P)-binding protein [Roseomonas marmotae]|uniref:FAD/NAD(P)-binding protein n=1 Tax=Roseomonas marmotae TaxID=2768161 RepID=A0ABS3KBY1_9PROT|nr:FAD/NAD(P)-binding protein [Roseomonas marmotae]MBO1074978.1 FAD/NAD(P)-binding protein [Roseomonas marmotae]QTI79982.1 FAD/NAD(P)-binding protein [Roseomonas marmotae]